MNDERKLALDASVLSFLVIRLLARHSPIRYDCSISYVSIALFCFELRLLLAFFFSKSG